MYYHIKQD